MQHLNPPPYYFLLTTPAIFFLRIQSVLFPFTLGHLSPRQKYTWSFYSCGMKHFMTQRWKAIKTHKSSLCQADTHKIQTYAPIPMERHIKFFGKQVTCLNVLQSKTTRSKAVGHQVGFILDAARESQSIRDHGISCDVLEHIQQGVPKLWAGLVSPVRSVPTLD